MTTPATLPSATVSVGDAVRDAGYAAGQSLLDTFGAWLAANGEEAPDQLSDSRFPELLQRFFVAQGWGDVTLAALSDGVLMLDARDWSEARVSANGCPVSTGLFAGFLGSLAGAPLSVLEVDPGSREPGRCRFLIGSIDVLEYIWQAMQSGVPYLDAAQRA